VKQFIQDEGKTIKWNLDVIKQRESRQWKRKLAKQQHTELKNEAKELIVQQRQRLKQVRKWEARNHRRRDGPTIVMDSGATSTCIKSSDAEHVKVLPIRSTKVFLNANGTQSPAGYKAELYHGLREPANQADLVPTLSTNSLLSTSKLADANYVTVFTRDEVQVFDAETTKFNIEGQAVMTGWRCPMTKLWRIPLKPDWQNMNTETTLLSEKVTKIMMEKRGQFDPIEFVNSVYELPNLEQVIAWYHAAAGYPTKTTWIKAIEAGFYATWPLLTVKAVKKHYPETDETPKGHLRRVKSGIRSTKVQVDEPEEIKKAEAALNDLRKKHRDIYIQVKDVTELIYTDQMGQFPVTSSQGHKYIMVLVEVDGNYIAMEPMKSREAHEMVRAYNHIIERLKSKGITPRRQMLDNEASKEYLKAIEKHGIEWELVPPDNHRQNVAEKGIQTAKGHIIAKILGCDDSFPFREWHRMLPQIELTLNLLRPANVRNTVSAHTYVHGVHDYNRMPLAPLGCRAQCYVDPERRTLYGSHTLDAWYVGTSAEHYRCHKVFMKDTRAERITDTLVFQHRRITNPTVSVADAVTNAANDLTEAIKGNMDKQLKNVDIIELERLATSSKKQPSK
jgi:hypothetical protein